MHAFGSTGCAAMNFMLLIHEPRGQRAERGRADGEAAYAAMQAFARDLDARGVFKACDSLLTDDRATRVQVRDGRARLVDGPFAEAKEMIGGYFLIDVPSHDAALKIAAECPAAAWATVEVRPVGPCFL
jgi:hypothetical protein